MGLIREVQQVSYTMNRQAREREQRQRQKIELENYSNEIKNNLQAEFYSYYKKDSVNAYKTILINKDYIIEKLTNYIESIKQYDQKAEKYYYIYKRKYDIVQDLQNNYFIELNKIKREHEQLEKIKTLELLNKLEIKLHEYFKNNENKKVVLDILKESGSVQELSQKLATDEAEKNIIYNNYYKTLSKVARFYQIDIQRQKELERDIIQRQKEAERIEQQKTRNKKMKRLCNLIIINHMLRNINKIL